MKGRVALFTSNRAEHGLLEPVMTELEKMMPDIHPFWAQDKQHPDDLVSGMESAAIAHHMAKADFAIVPCDRQEMVGAALYLFYSNIPFAQLHAGDTGSGIHDEVGRWIISRCASIHFCNSPESAQNLIKSGEETWRIHLVGSTAFDGIEPDDRIMTRIGGAPSPAYTDGFLLVLVHPDTYSREATQKAITDAVAAMIKYPIPAVVIGGNRDKHWEVVDDYWRQFTWPQPWRYFSNGLERREFLSLMKHCTKFITNSSSALYELPAFDVTKWVNIGLRNANRKPLQKIEKGGSQRIAQVIRNLEIDDKLLRKKFV